mgnify:CR=1 FL=1
MKKIVFTLLALFVCVSMNSQTLMQVKREGGYTNVRSGRGTNYSIVTKYKDGSDILVGPNQNGWRAVYNDYGNFIGYISSSKVVSKSSSSRKRYTDADAMRILDCYDAVVARIKPEGGYTNVRSTPNGRIVTKIKDGTTVFVLYTDCDWHMVYNTSGKYLGYVHYSKLVYD